MKDIIFDNFQNDVNESLLRHRSILDIMTKLNEANARVNRALAKSVTNCGCIKISAKKQDTFTENNESSPSLITHIEGELCDNCREVIENEVGNNIFYLTSLCNCLDLNLYDIFLKEENKIDILGKFSLR
jgi:hypothetical protein